MGAIKFDVRSSDPAKAIAGGGEQAPVGMYVGKIVSVVDEKPEGKDRRLHVIYEITHSADGGKKLSSYAQLHDYITFAESQDWKMDQFLQAIGAATSTKRTGSFDPDKQKGKKIKLRVKGETYNEEYRAKPGGVWKADGGPSAGAEDEPDEDESDENSDENSDETWAEIGARIDEQGDEELPEDVAAMTEAAEELGVDPDDFPTWEELGSALDSGDDTDEPSEEGDEDEGSDEDEEGGEDESYNDWSIADLKAELEARELSTSGAKSVLVARLEENDEEAGPFDE